MRSLIQYRHLRAFVEIAHRRSLKRAAEALHLTQPAISKTLRELEEELGATLLVRNRAGSSLTPQGAAFLQFAEMSLSALAQGLNSVETLRSGGGGQLTVGALPSVAARLMPRVVERYARIAPNTRLSIIDGPHRFILEQLRLGVLDLALGRLGAEDQMQGISFTQLYLERVAMVVRPDHPLVGRPVRLADLADWPVLYPSQGAAIRPLVDRLLIAAGVPELPNRIETVSHAFGAIYTRASDAVWIISEGVVTGDVAAGMLHPLPIDTSLTQGPVGLLARADQQTPPMQSFVTAVWQAVGDLAQAAGGARPS